MASKNDLSKTSKYQMTLCDLLLNLYIYWDQIFLSQKTHRELKALSPNKKYD